MRMKTSALLAAMVAISAASPLLAAPWEGTIKLGGVLLDESGDLSAVQETYNIYEGFNLTRLRLSGAPANHYLMFDLREINLDGRKADLLYRRSGLLKIKAHFDQHRQVFDPDRAVTSKRKDFKVGARLTPTRWLRVSADYGLLNRTGSRLPYPSPPSGWLGTTYDNTLNTGGLGIELRKDRLGLAVDYRVSDFANDASPVTDRTGKVVSARLHTPGFIYDKLTHMLRFAYGVSDLPSSDFNYTLTRFQYTGVVRPVAPFQLKYNFRAQRMDNQSTELKTDRFQNALDVTYYHGNGSVFAGYEYETSDDDLVLTNYHTWRAGTTFRNDTYLAKLYYAGRIKKDEEELTLLKDLEASRFRADLEVTPVSDLALGVGFHDRQREFPDIDVESEGKSIRTHASYAYPNWGGILGTYVYTKDKYRDLAGSFKVNSHVVTGRIDFERIGNLLLSGGLTFMKVGEDLDIEKSILFFEGTYTVLDNLHFEIKYNIYNYDDFILLDRYYTANVVWFNIGYDLRGE